MDSKAVIIASCWFSIAVIASVYMIIFADQLGDVMFGVFLPVGALVLVGLIVTLVVSPKQEQKA